MAAKFRPKHTVAVGSATVEIGRRSNQPAFRITTTAGALFICDESTVNDMADALDEAIDKFEADPLLWEGSS